MSKRDMAQRRIRIINELKAELKELKGHRKDILEEDPEYSELKEQSKLVKDQTRTKRKQVLDAPEYKAVTDQMSDIRAEIRDQKEALSQELVELYKEEGVTEIEDSEGNLKKLKFSVQLVNA
ncbi:hypothetical protein GF360_01845 [candidate division WWE3 bacterium]|nr:hypothetical protein [candidate division WWE3 bacterium]